MPGLKLAALATVGVIGAVLATGPAAAQYDNRFYADPYAYRPVYPPPPDDGAQYAPPPYYYAQQPLPPQPLYQQWRQRPQPSQGNYPQYWTQQPGAELRYGEATRQLNLEQLDR